MTNVYTYYDTNKTVIARIRPNIDHSTGRKYITRRTYNRLMKLRTIGGEAGIYTDNPCWIFVLNNNGEWYRTI